MVGVLVGIGKVPEDWYLMVFGYVGRTGRETCGKAGGRAERRVSGTGGQGMMYIYIYIYTRYIEIIDNVEYSAVTLTQW